MAKRSSRSSAGRGPVDDAVSRQSGSGTSSDSGETTGRMIVTFRDGSTDGLKKGVSRLHSVAGVSSVSRMSDYGTASLDIADIIALC